MVAPKWPPGFSFFQLSWGGAEYSFYVKSIASYAPTFLGYNNSVLAIVKSGFLKNILKFYMIGFEICIKRVAKTC